MGGSERAAWAGHRRRAAPPRRWRRIAPGAVLREPDRHQEETGPDGAELTYSGVTAIAGDQRTCNDPAASVRPTAG